VPTPTPPAELAILVENTLKAAGLALEDFFYLLFLALNPWAKDRDARIKILGAQFTNILKLLPGWIWAIFQEGSDESLADLAGVFVNIFNTLAPDALADAGTAAVAAMEWVRQPLTAAGNITPGNQTPIAEAMYGRAWTMGELAHGLAMLAGILPLGLSRAFSGFAALVAQGAGFEQITDAILGSWIKAGLARPNEYQANAQFRSRAPGGEDAHEMYARELITPAQYAQLLGWDGLMTEFESPMLQQAYRAISPFMLIRLLDAGALAETDARNLMTFGSIRASDQDVMIKAGGVLALRPYETQALSALLISYEHGTATDADLDNALAAMSLPDGAEQQIHVAAKQRKIEYLVGVLHHVNSEGYEFGQVTDADYISNLTGAGMTEEMAQAYYGIDSIKKAGKAAASEARAAAAEASKVRRAAIAAANRQYLAGVYGQPTIAAPVSPGAATGPATRAIAEALLLAARLAAGEDPALAALGVTLMQLRAAGNLVKVYNLLLDHADAAILRSKVAAIREQAVKKAIDSTTELAQLELLGLSAAWAQSLVAKDAAQASKVALPV